jgi:hypothetical protein
VPSAIQGGHHPRLWELPRQPWELPRQPWELPRQPWELPRQPWELPRQPWAFDSRWVPPVGGVPSRHTGTGGAADGVHDQHLSGESSGAPRQQLGKQPDEAAARQAAGRGDVEQPRRCSGRQAGAHRSRRGEDSPLTRLADLQRGLR